MGKCNNDNVVTNQYDYGSADELLGDVADMIIAAGTAADDSFGYGNDGVTDDAAMAGTGGKKAWIRCG